MDPSSRNYQGILRLKDRGFVPDAILDIGAHSGAWSRAARVIYPDAYMLMVEPLAEKAASLQATCRDIGNAGYAMELLGERELPDVTFFVVNAASDQSGSSKYSEATHFPQEKRLLPQRTLDLLLGQASRPFQFLKMDVQGAELDILRGAPRVLATVEAILMEVAVVQYNKGAPLVAAVLPAMAELGFRMYDILDEIRAPEADRRLRQFDALFLRDTSRFLL